MPRAEVTSSMCLRATTLQRLRLPTDRCAMTSLTQVRVDVFEPNAHAPVFASDLYHASTAENNDVGVLLTRVEARDADPRGNRIRYRLDPRSAAAATGDA